MQLLLREIATKAITFTHILVLSRAFQCNLPWNSKVVTHRSVPRAQLYLYINGVFLYSKEVIYMYIFYPLLHHNNPQRLNFQSQKNCRRQ